MKLHEYQAKSLLAAYGVVVPRGEVATSPDAARAAAERLGPAVVVKAQVLVGGRGKAGGIVRVETPQQAACAAERLLGSVIREEPVKAVLVEPLVGIAQELYLGLTVDRQTQRIALIGSAQGGVEIEETARLHPEAVHLISLDPMLGLKPYHGLHLARAMGLPRALWPSFGSISAALYRAGQEKDALLIEINPLVVSAAGSLIALDAKVIVDDNALFRQKELASWGETGVSVESAVDRLAREAAISYVKLAGSVGCMVNGAGLAMATMDLIKLCGGEPANFTDIGGGARAERVAVALRIILSDPQVRSVLINIFGGITRCDEVARGILAAREQVPTGVPFVVRLVGTNEAEGRRILEQAQLSAAATLADAARLAVAAAS